MPSASDRQATMVVPRCWRSVRSEYLTSEPPASTAVQVAALVVPEALIEIDLVAVVPA